MLIHYRTFKIGKKCWRANLFDEQGRGFYWKFFETRAKAEAWCKEVKRVAAEKGVVDL